MLDAAENATREAAEQRALANTLANDEKAIQRSLESQYLTTKAEPLQQKVNSAGRSVTQAKTELREIENTVGEGERTVSTPASRVQLWCVPTNEEIVVARQSRDLLKGHPG